MYLRRKIDEFLFNWKSDENRKPLIIKGARQVGKTESITHFGFENYESVININFILESRYKSILSGGYDVDNIVNNITLIDPSKQFIPGETLIIFDEIQDFPDIATSLKSFHIDKRYDVICSGSLLGINYKQIHSNSVGNKTDYEMFSMDFEEFLWAVGYKPDRIDSILNHMIDLEPFNETEMETYSELFLRYCVLGGMPAVVESYTKNRNFTGTLDIQKQILHDYEEDVRKYVEGLDQTRIISILRSIPSQLAKENKKFQFSKVDKKARAREYSGCVDWLSDSGIINTCYCMGFPELPIKGNVDRSKFKLYYADTGLLIANLDEEAQEDLRANRNLGVYKGALYENFVAEAFEKQGLSLCYYKKENSELEEDFFVRTKEELIPVEVKSNTNRSKSLKMLIEQEHYTDIKHGIKLSTGNVGFANNIYTFPYFCCFLIKKFLSSNKI